MAKVRKKALLPLVIICYVVVSFVLPSDEKLCTIIRRTITQEDLNFDQIFSRNKMLKRRIDKLLRKTNI